MALAVVLIQATKSLIIFHSKTPLNKLLCCSPVPLRFVQMAAAGVGAWVTCYFLPYPCSLFNNLVLLKGEVMHLKTNGLSDC